MSTNSYIELPHSWIIRQLQWVITNSLWQNFQTVYLITCCEITIAKLVSPALCSFGTFTICSKNKTGLQFMQTILLPFRLTQSSIVKGVYSISLYCSFPSSTSQVTFTSQYTCLWTHSWISYRHWVRSYCRVISHGTSCLRLGSGRARDAAHRELALILLSLQTPFRPAWLPPLTCVMWGWQCTDKKDTNNNRSLHWTGQ